MPIIPIHEEVAIRIANKNKTLETKDFYLGVCAPDSVNLNGFADKETRWTAHQRKKDLNAWRISLKEFYNKEKKNYPKQFILGYVTHILTDIIFDDYFYDDIKEQIIKDNISDEDPHELMGKDMQYYFNNSTYQKDIINVLTNHNKFYNILNITEEEMKHFIEKVLTTTYEFRQNKYITDSTLTKLTDKVLEELNEYLEN